jgi:thiamine biosynthesis lipoprotein
MTRALTGRVEHIMGMPISIDVRRVNAEGFGIDRCLEECFASLREVDDLLSLWRQDTPLARLARGELDVADCPPEIAEVLGLAAEAYIATDGWFDGRRPGGGIDPTGLAKGWALARVGRILTGAGVEEWCVNAAGDLLVRGAGWRIGIADPRDTTAVITVLEVGDTAVCTSGITERGRHIWNPYTGQPADAILAVTVVCSDPVRADVLATAAVARGPSALEWLGRMPGVQALVVPTHGEPRSTQKFLRTTAHNGIHRSEGEAE